MKFCTRFSKGLKLKVRKFWGLILTFVEVTGKKLSGGGLLHTPPPPILNRVKSPENIKHKDMKIKIEGHIITLHRVLFQSSFLIFYSTHGRLSKLDCNWSSKGKETNSCLDTFTEQTILDFLLTTFSPHSTTKFVVL